MVRSARAHPQVGHGHSEAKARLVAARRSELEGLVEARALPLLRVRRLAAVWEAGHLLDVSCTPEMYSTQHLQQIVVHDV